MTHRTPVPRTYNVKYEWWWPHKTGRISFLTNQMNLQDKQSNVKGKIRLFVVGCTCEYGDIDSSNEMVSMTF